MPKAWLGGVKPSEEQIRQDLPIMLRSITYLVNRGHGDVMDVPDPVCEAAADEIERLRSALSLALVERDRARTDALEEAAKACESLIGSDATPTLRPGARMCLHRIRALNPTPALNAPEEK